MEILITAAKVQ